MAKAPAATGESSSSTRHFEGELSSQGWHYDAVPLEQVEPFLKRMRLVEELIEKYGRAYDYRIHTVRDLEEIRAQLEADARIYSNKSARVAPAVPAVPLLQTPNASASETAKSDAANNF